MKEYHAVFSVDTGFFDRLDGTYKVEGYILRPCLITTKNQETGYLNFVLEFDFFGLTENIANSSEKGRRSLINLNKAAQIAKEFVAWLVLSTREWARLSCQSHGHLMAFGPCTHCAVEDFDESVLETVYHVDSKAKNGEFFNVQRPSFSLDGVPKASSSLKLPSDFPILTKKMSSLVGTVREKFLNACFSYQFALDNWMPYPTVSILSLVSAVESVMVDEYTSGFCRDAGKACPLKKDVMKKFRGFFERNIRYPLPKELKSFLDTVYSKRSTYAHKALLGEGEVRGIQFCHIFEQVQRLSNEQRQLEQLVNAALMEWFQRI